MKINTANFQWIAIISMALIDALKNEKESAIINSRDKVKIPEEVKYFIKKLGCKIEKPRTVKSSLSTHYIIHLSNPSEELNLINLRWLIMIAGAIPAYMSKPKKNEFLTVDYYYDEMTPFLRHFLSKLHCEVEEHISEYNGKLEYRIYLPEEV